MAKCIVQTGNSAGVNVRASKSTGSTKLGVIDNGVTVNVVRCDATWATLVYNGTPAFVQHRYLSGEPTVNGDGLSSGDSAVCNANSVNIRNAANGSTIGNQLNKGANVSVIGKSLANGYYWYQIGAGRWVRGDFLAPGTGSGSGGGSGGSGTGGSDDPIFTAGHFGCTTTTGVRLRKSPGSNDFVQVVKGSMFYIEGTETGPTISGSSSTTWVKVRFGKGDGTHESRYIHSSCFGNVQTLANAVKPRIVAIAKSLEKNKGEGLGLSGDWCQRFIYFLIGACGINNLSVPASGYCGEARSTWVNYYEAVWHERGDNYTPSSGDLIYYGDLGSAVSSHVGIVVTGGSSFKTIEGNMGTETNQAKHKVKLCSGSVSTGKCNNKYYQGFLRLTY